MVYLRNIDANGITLSAKTNKVTGKKDIYINPSKSKKVPLKGQLGDDDMENPVRPLKAPESYENSDPDKPSVFTCVDDKDTEEFFRTLDKVLPQEMERLGLAGPKQYPPDQYRPVWVEPAEEGQTGAVSIKMNLAGDTPCEISKLVDDGEGGLDQVDAKSRDIKPGAVQAMYYKISFSKIWKVKKEWGTTIWANQIVLRGGEEDDDMVLPGAKPKAAKKPTPEPESTEPVEGEGEEDVGGDGNDASQADAAREEGGEDNGEDEPTATQEGGEDNGEDATQEEEEKPKKRRRKGEKKSSKRHRKDDSEDEE